MVSEKRHDSPSAAARRVGNRIGHLIDKESRTLFHRALICYRQRLCDVCERMRCGELRVDVVWPNDDLMPSPSHPSRRMHHILNRRSALLYLMREYQRGNVRLICMRCDNIRIHAFRRQWFPRLVRAEDWRTARAASEAGGGQRFRLLTQA